MSKSIFLDIETTGFSRQWDDIIEIAAILVDDNSGKIIDIFHEYIKPRRKITAQITQLTRITNEMVSSCRGELLVLMDFTEWIALSKPDKIVGHNCKSFDLGFIRDKCKYYNIGFETGAEIIDTLSVARSLKKDGLINVENCKQPTLAHFFGIEYEAHSAIEDVKALIQIYNKMCQLSENDVGF